MVFLLNKLFRAMKDFFGIDIYAFSFSYRCGRYIQFFLGTPLFRFCLMEFGLQHFGVHARNDLALTHHIALVHKYALDAPLQFGSDVGLGRFNSSIAGSDTWEIALTAIHLPDNQAYYCGDQ